MISNQCINWMFEQREIQLQYTWYLWLQNIRRSLLKWTKWKNLFVSDHVSLHIYKWRHILLLFRIRNAYFEHKSFTWIIEKVTTAKILYRKNVHILFAITPNLCKWNVIFQAWTKHIFGVFIFYDKNFYMISNSNHGYDYAGMTV